MIKFRQKYFALPLIGLVASTGAGIGVSAVQTSAHHKKDAAQAEEFQRQNEIEQRKQNEALNRIAKAAENNPEKAQQAAAVIAQKSYAAASPGLLKQAGNVAFEVAKGLKGNGKAREKLAKGLAIGTTMAVASYGADKWIQADRKKLTGGAELPKPQVDPEEAKKKRNKKIAKIGAAGLATVGTVLAAKSGRLGAGWERVANRSAEQWKGTASRFAKDFRTGVKENIIPAKGSGAAGLLGPGLTVAFPALTIGGYALGERKQLKEQAAQQQKQYADIQEQGNPRKKSPGSVLKKVAVGTAAAATAIAAGRRGAFGAKAGRYLNDWYMSRGAQLSRLSNGKYGQGMIKSGADKWAKFNRETTDKALKKANQTLVDAKAGKKTFRDLFRSNEQIIAKNKERISQTSEEINRLRNMRNMTGAERSSRILSGQDHTSFTKSVLDSKPVRFITFQEGDHQKFLQNLAKNAKHDETKKVANFLTTGTGKTLAAVGSVGVGAVAMYPFTVGDKAVRGVTGAVDKNAFAYEKSKDQEIK